MFLYFDLKQVDIAIIRLGGGWQFDQCSFPPDVICASIGFDHTETLGDSLLDIANHKAGVMRKTHLSCGQWYTAEVEHLLLTKKSHDI